MILVRNDLSGYQHLHPTMSKDGTWSVEVDFANSGTWRIIADSIPNTNDGSATRTVVGDNITVEGTDSPIALPEASTTINIDGYKVELSGKPGINVDKSLTFTISKDGKSVKDLKTYLGAFGHLVALRQDDLSYTHLHPTDKVNSNKGGPDLDFEASLPSTGTYRLYLQFADSKNDVHSAEFTVKI